MARAASALVVCAFLLSGCLGGDESRSLTAAQLPKLVLQPFDVPAFEQFDEGPQAAADAPLGSRAEPRRFGRKAGWKARYRRPGGPATSGPLVIDSRVDLFDRRGGAAEDLVAYGEDFGELARNGRAGRARVLPPPDLGDAATAMTFLQDGVPDVRFFTVAWRFRNVTASVAVNGFDGKLVLDDALALARRQQRRIAAVE